MQAPGTARRLGQARRARPNAELADRATGSIVAIDLGTFKSVDGAGGLPVDPFPAFEATCHGAGQSLPGHR